MNLKMRQMKRVGAGFIPARANAKEAETGSIKFHSVEQGP